MGIQKTIRHKEESMVKERKISGKRVRHSIVGNDYNIYNLPKNLHYLNIKKKSGRHRHIAIINSEDNLSSLNEDAF